MATINNLATSVSEMLDDVLFERIRSIRKYRRTPVEKKNKVKKASKVSMDSLVSKLSSTEREDLIKMLERS